MEPSPDPYSTAHIESKFPSSPTKGTSRGDGTDHHLFCSETEFYSRIGKRLLTRIWQEGQLDKELTSFGVRERKASIREKVSDYFQHYLIQRARRFSISRKVKPTRDHLSASKSHLSSLNQRKESKVYLKYSGFINHLHSERDSERKEAEVARIRKLLISGKIRTAPKQGFDDVFEDPVYKVNRLLESVIRLGEEEIIINDLPLAIELGESESVNIPRRRRKRESRSASSSSSSSSRTPSWSWWTFLRRKREAIIALGGFKDDPFQLSPHHEEEEIELPDLHHERSISVASLISNLSDAELSWKAERELPDHHHQDLSGELEIEDEFLYKEKDGVLAFIKSQETCEDMYEVGWGIVQMHSREKLACEEFLQVCRTLK